MLSNKVQAVFSAKNQGIALTVQAGDLGRELVFELMQYNGTSYEVMNTTGCTVAVVYRYTDATEIECTTPAMTATRNSDGTFRTVIPAAPLARNGTVKAQVRITDKNNNVVSSAPLVIEVVESFTPSNVADDPAVPILVQLIAETIEATEACETATAAIPTTINSQKGAENGIAPLDASKYVPLANIPPLDYSSKWQFYAEGNPVTIHPAAGSRMRIAPSAAGMMWAGGKNWLNPNITRTTKNGITVEWIDGGYIKISGTCTTDNTLFTLPSVTLLTGEYRISRQEISGAATVVGYNGLQGIGGTFFGFVSLVGSIVTVATTTINTPSVRIDKGSIFDDYILGLQVEFGTAATPFEAYREGSSTYALTANTPVEVTAIGGGNHLIASAGTLAVSYNRDSMDLVDQLTVPISATGSAAQIDGCIDGVPLGIVARCVAVQSGTGEPSLENVRAIQGKSLVNVSMANGKNLYRAAAMKSSAIAIKNGGLEQTQTPIGTTFYSSKDVSGLLPYGTLTISCVASNSAGFADATDIGFRALRGGIAVKTDKTVTYEPGMTLVILYYNNKSNPAAVGVTYTNYWTNIQIELGSTATAYEPYQGNTYALALPEPLYGLPGAEDEVNLLEGVCVQRTVQFTLTSVSAHNQARLLPNTILAYSGNPAGVSFPQMSTNVICDKSRPAASWQELTTSDIEGVSTYNAVITGGIGIRLRKSRLSGWDDNWTDAQITAAVNAYLAVNPYTVVAPRVTPRVVAFTPPTVPALSGANTVYTDAGGDTTLTGRMSAKGAYDKLAARVLALEDIATQ